MNAKKESDKSGTYDIYVGHVPKAIQEAAFIEAFSKYGNVADVLIRHTSTPLGYAIVKFKEKKDAENVLKFTKTISIDNYDMEVRNGKRSNKSSDNVNGVCTSTKSVHFAETGPSVQYLDNVYHTETPIAINDFQYPIYPTSETALAPVTVEIMCTNVENAITFYGCHINRFEELQHLSIKLNSICPNLHRLLRKPVINRVYGAMYSADCQWYRCRVLQYGMPANSTSCTVEYIDYGNVAEVCYTDMVELPEPLKNLNPFAIKCIFTNLSPSSKSINCVSYLHHLINRRMSLCAFNVWGSLEYLVTKCSCNGIDVIDELLRNGHAIYKNQEFSKNASPKADKSSKNQESKKQKKGKDNPHNKKTTNNCNGTSKTKHSHEAKNGGITVLEKTDRSSLAVESLDFMPKKIIKRKNDTVNNKPVLEAKAVNQFLKVDSVICNVKVVNNIRSLIPLNSYDDLISEAVDLLKMEINITVSKDLKQTVENARQEYCEALEKIKECSDLNQLEELKKLRNQKRTELCNELEQYLKAFDCTMLEKRKKIQETITALESNSTAWLNIYLPKIPETVDDLLIAFNEEKEKKRKSIEMARRNTDEKREKFTKVYSDLGKEFSLDIVNNATDDVCIVNNVGKKGSWALKFDEALTEFSLALEEERKISTVIEDRSYVSVIQCILEKLDVPKDKIDAECVVYEKYKSLYDDLMNSLDLSPIFEELREIKTVIDSFSSCPNHRNTDKLLDEHAKLHSALLREDALLATVIKASTQHFPELIGEHPELKLEEYQKYFCLLKFSWNLHFFPLEDKCNRIEPAYISNLDREPVVLKEFNFDNVSINNFINRVKLWNGIKSPAIGKIRGLFMNKCDSSKCSEASCSTFNKFVNEDTTQEIQAEVPKKVIHDENQNAVASMNGDLDDTNQTICQWIDCKAGSMTHEELVLHLLENHIEKDGNSFVCQWKKCPSTKNTFKTAESLIIHIQKHIGEKTETSTTRNIIYVVLEPAWEALYDKPLPMPVDFKVALNVLQQVLEGLCSIHSRGIIHGAIHPMSILHSDGKIILDFNFIKQPPVDKLCLNGINFQVPKEDLYKSADMYRFGCLVLWVLFPNLSFQSTDDGVPNINAFQSIIENMLLPKDFAALSKLVNINCNLRPTSRILRSSGFLKDLRIMSRSISS